MRASVLSSLECRRAGDVARRLRRRRGAATDLRAGARPLPRPRMPALERDGFARARRANGREGRPALRLIAQLRRDHPRAWPCDRGARIFCLVAHGSEAAAARNLGVRLQSGPSGGQGNCPPRITRARSHRHSTRRRDGAASQAVRRRQRGTLRVGAPPVRLAPSFKGLTRAGGGQAGERTPGENAWRERLERTPGENAWRERLERTPGENAWRERLERTPCGLATP
jgi:hypothetical protein